MKNNDTMAAALAIAAALVCATPALAEGAAAGGDAAAPAFIQFSDHRIAPQKSDHYHLSMGDDRAALLGELTNWPTYYPASLGAGDIVQEMIAH